jgi:phage FluMu protein Com
MEDHKDLSEIRCPHCNKLFFKASLVEGVVEIKCKNCKNISTFNVSSEKESILNDGAGLYERKRESE